MARAKRVYWAGGLFDLKDLNGLSERILALLSDDKKREKIAEAAYSRASAEDTWKSRAELFLAYCDEL